MVPHALLPLYLLDCNHSLPSSAFSVDFWTETVGTAVPTVLVIVPAVVDLVVHAAD